MYVQRLCEEIKAVTPWTGHQDFFVHTLFFGGGTPSILPAEYIGQILDTLRTRFSFSPNAELTIEANPGTVDEKKLREYRCMGINRISFGVQATKNTLLSALGRIHTVEEFLESYQLARQAGFTNINTDLMFGLPGQSCEDWEQTLHQIAKLGPEHISAYGLILEEGTRLYEKYCESPNHTEPYPPLPSEEEERTMYHKTKEILFRYGYSRYEISNFSKPGYECRHNLDCWRRQDYLGFGLGAASLYQNCRFRNTSVMSEYMNDDFTSIHREIESLSKQAQMEEFIFLGLRTMEGIYEKDFQQQFGENITLRYSSVLKKNKALGLLNDENGRWFLTEKGIDVSNVVLADFLE